MAKQIGSQYRETLEESGYTLANERELTDYGVEAGGVVLIDEDGNPELWVKHDDHAGYTIEVNGVGHEFAHSIDIY